MKTDLKDVKNRELKIGDTIAMCDCTYSLSNWGKAGKEYQFDIGEVYFKKGRVQWTGTDQIGDYKIYDGDFLIVKRGRRLMAKLNKGWNWEKNKTGI